MSRAVVLFNLGGPDGLEAVEPFLGNLFSDPAIIGAPGFLRRPLARLLARRRAPVAKAIYRQIGGRSPIREETEAQARALEAELDRRGMPARCVVAMRYWRPFIREAVMKLRDGGAAEIVLLPLYPQYSTTTTASSFAEWNRAAGEAGLAARTVRVCCYPAGAGFAEANAALLREALARRKPGVAYRVLFSAHGLPERVVKRGDPYQWQIERSAEAIVAALGMPGLDWRVAYQSRVGPLKWIGPATDDEIRVAGREGLGVVVVPVAFVSEHSETLAELDIEYAGVARSAGAADYIRVRAVGTHPRFVAMLGDLVERALAGGGAAAWGPQGAGTVRICPAALGACGHGG